MWENTEQRDSFIMYTEQWPALSLLSDAQLADLMRAIFALHGAGCSAPELDLPTQAVFLLMRPRFGANKARYEEICRRNQENGRRGGRPRRAASADPAGPRGAKDADGSAAAGEAEETPPAPGSGVVRGGVRKARSAGGAGGGSRRGAETPPEAFSAEEAAGRSIVGDTAAGSIVGVAPEAPADETAEATAEPETEAPRTREEIETDLAAAQADLDALYEELMPKAQEVVDKFNAGASFDELIDEYNEDPGMQNEPTKTEGYAVCAESTSWDAAFRDGAMSIESVGGISEPVRGSYGIHIIYYLSDIPAGAVAYEDVHDQVEADALNDAKDAAYETAVNLWLDEAEITYHYDRL